MIRVTRLGREGLSGFYIAGHAGYGAYGRDIVCAGVSALAQSARLALLHYGVPLRTYRDDDGVLCVLASPTREQKPVSDAILTTAALGMSRIAATYPGCVRVRPQYGGGNHDI